MIYILINFRNRIMESSQAICIAMNQPLQSKVKEGPFLIKQQSSSNKSSFVLAGQWNPKENLRYIAFLKVFNNQLETKEPKKRWSLFYLASRFIRTRNTNQCRNYYIRIKQQFVDQRAFISYTSKNNRNFYRYLDCYQEQLYQFIQQFQLNIKKQVQETSLRKSTQTISEGLKQGQGSTDINYMKSQERIQKLLQKKLNMPKFFIDYFYPKKYSPMHSNYVHSRVASFPNRFFIQSL